MIFRQVLHALAPRLNWVVRLHLAQPAQNVVFFWFPDADASVMTSEASPCAAYVIFRQVLRVLALRRNWVVRLLLAQPAHNLVFFLFSDSDAAAMSCEDAREYADAAFMSSEDSPGNRTQSTRILSRFRSGV